MMTFDYLFGTNIYFLLIATLLSKLLQVYIDVMFAISVALVIKEVDKVVYRYYIGCD